MKIAALKSGMSLVLFPCVLAGTFLLLTPLHATNGLFPSAYSARSAGMGGADLARAGGLSSLIKNPSGMARLRETQLELGVGLLKPDLTYEDEFRDADPSLAYTNSVESEPAVFPLPYFSLAGPLGENMGWGISFYALGGVGASFQGIRRPLAFPGNSPMSLNTVLGANLPGGDTKLITENTFSQVAFATITPGFAMRFGSLSVGFALDLGLSRMEWRWTFSDPTNRVELPGAGYRYKSDAAYALSGKIGLTWELSENLALAYAYQAKSRYYHDGRISVNAGSANPVHANQARVSAYLELPEIHRAGISLSLNALTFSLDLSYIAWAAAFRTVDFNLDRPAVQLPFGNFVSVLPFGVRWNDQRVIALGVEFKPAGIAFRAGYNYGRAAAREAAANPLFPAISEHHVMVGLGFTFGEMELDLALEYSPKTRIEGDLAADWALFHAVFSATDVRVANFRHAVTMRQITPRVGLTWKF